ncbi:(2Fe-2S) ferredoxin domain-containing protein [Halobacterium sp. KA-4]|jgi:(2Fe-2S) ferredoxin|uniref:(2Fe-2S) ferredoxin domain-containing protein n=1 Tax=unclassified Halobacterium TaxID=2668073 RepID=UPI001E65219B|nr:(2Fe-2S) ferredoxin domain-containing protein [Halobacterium sp. KA-4]MCD2201108.1 (2Fe-2S) ferredoxin domain-containing protein [Halobacterium sp. KA-4]
MQSRTKDVHENGFTDQVIVCTQARDADFACCAGAFGDDVYEAVQAWLRERDVFWSHVYVSETSCLGLCSADGAALAIQPRDRWYSDVQPNDVPALLTREFGADATQLGPNNEAHDAH